MIGITSRIALLLALTLPAGCGGGGGGSSAAVPSSTQNAGTSVVTVLSNGLPVAGSAVTLSTGFSGTTATGVISTQTTVASGQTTFTNLPAGGTLCVSELAVVGPGITYPQYACPQPFPAQVTLSSNSNGP